MMLLYFIIATSVVNAHIPDHYEKWAEPDGGPEYHLGSQTARLSIDNSLERLTALRQVLTENYLDAYIVPTADAHNSQYIAPSDARRVWISGLAGSSGTAVVTDTQALLWTDSRYFTQFFMQVDTEHWQLMRQGIDPPINNWLAQNLTANSRVGVDPTTYTRTAWNSLQATLSSANIELVATPNNLVDIARTNIGDPPPGRPNNDLIVLPVEFSGRLASHKITELSDLMLDRGATALVLTALDDIAYTLNIRGSDIPYNPVFFSYLIIRTDVDAPNNVILFWGTGVLPSEITEHLSSEGLQIETRPYADIFNYLSEFSSELPPSSVIWLPDSGSHAIYTAAEAGNASILSTLSPVSNIKCIKNDVELSGFRSAHVKDGVAVVRGLRWIEEAVAAGEVITEIDLSDKLAEFRREEADSYGPSFSTIAGAGENGAVIHYSPPREGSRVIRSDDMLLVDSGGQYIDGTTDITRTRHVGASPSFEQSRAFTRVLKGQILMATAVFPRGIQGHRLETLARKALWDVGLDYGHGTGHGVGHFLNVHEGPSGILSGPIATDPGIVEKMIFSNEPGYYEVGEYGIRHEDLVEVIVVNSTSDHIMADSIVGDFAGVGALGFYTISLVPHQTACLDVELLTDLEIKYINDYHARVLSTLGPILQERELFEDYNWLERECAPIARSAAILLTSSPFWIVAVIVFRL
ncbi:xaa-Pro aminopeptidase ApepP [Amyelois transitella]|uniref:xaa-Pro aminopeptidase ApepP n=1 Tax=Amyelois transitella TaxID=680683 RepID=UPI00298FF835|nr:xaa-Pro aminopeptidase ApepP [Amyelois transitella]